MLLLGAGLFSIVSIIYSIDIITFKSKIEINNNWTEKSFSSIFAHRITIHTTKWYLWPLFALNLRQDDKMTRQQDNNIGGGVVQLRYMQLKIHATTITVNSNCKLQNCSTEKLHFE